ncbi:MAG: transcriptional regulator BetI [Labrys sp. (in: a-proteobacteria)]|jgi:AcrR family transcriptional regulator
MPINRTLQRDMVVRRASREVRRLQLIEATIDSLATRGFSETTMAEVAKGAGLSNGIVNFHFESKEKLLIATLQHMADEYADHWRSALEKAGPDPAARLWALVVADFDPRICSRRKLAAWCAFWGEARSRPTYQAHCGARDRAYQIMFQNLFLELAAATPASQRPADPPAIALVIDALLDGLWLRMMFDETLTRKRALAAAQALLIEVFPQHFASRKAASDDDADDDDAD